MMSFDFHNYPGASMRCDVCKRDDCSKGDQLWLHLLTIETDGGYRPVIGHTCLRGILENSTLKPEPVVHEVVREPSDEEIGAFIRKVATRLFDKHAPEGLKVEVPDDIIPNHARDAATHTRGNARQRKSAVGEGTN